MQRQEAEEHLRIIRSLMEKATVYRAIAAPTALVAGLLALLGAFIGPQIEAGPEQNIIGHDLFGSGLRFCLLWAGILAVVSAANGLFLYLDAKRRGEKFVSSGMKMALKALLPSHITAVVLTFTFQNNTPLIATCWCLMHGLGLLATSHFSPRSMIYLGWGFLLAGLASLLLVSAPHVDFSSTFSPHLLMGITFGGFHLVYAACTWPRGTSKASA